MSAHPEPPHLPQRTLLISGMAGMLPTVLGIHGDNSFRAPMAVAMIGGPAGAASGGWREGAARFAGEAAAHSLASRSTVAQSQRR